MIETVIHYHPEFRSGQDGRPLRFGTRKNQTRMSLMTLAFSTPVRRMSSP